MKKILLMFIIITLLFSSIVSAETYDTKDLDTPLSFFDKLLSYFVGGWLVKPPGAECSLISTGKTPCREYIANRNDKLDSSNNDASTQVQWVYRAYNDASCTNVYSSIGSGTYFGNGNSGDQPRAFSGKFYDFIYEKYDCAGGIKWWCLTSDKTKCYGATESCKQGETAFFGEEAETNCKKSIGCIDECTIRLQKKCIDEQNYKICMDYDEDACLEWKNIECESGKICKDGACTEKEWCEDTDNGINYKTKGTVTDEIGVIGTDYCDGDIIVEFYCSNSEPGHTTYNCKNFGSDYICKDGECTKEEPIGCTYGNWGDYGCVIKEGGICGTLTCSLGKRCERRIKISGGLDCPGFDYRCVKDETCIEATKKCYTCIENTLDIKTIKTPEDCPKGYQEKEITACGEEEKLECIEEEAIFYSDSNALFKAKLWVVVPIISAMREGEVSAGKVDEIIPGFSKKYFENPKQACCGDLKHEFMKEKRVETSKWSFFGTGETAVITYSQYRCVKELEKPTGELDFCFDWVVSFGKGISGDATDAQACQYGWIAIGILFAITLIAISKLSK